MKSVSKLIPFITLTLDLVPRVNSQNCSQQYTVVSGDTCDGIGAEFNVTSSGIISANPIISYGCNNLTVGHILCIPDGSCSQKYTVLRGDSCDGIGAEFNVTGSAIISANPAINYGCTNLRAGQILCIPGGSCAQQYTVKSGESCDGIGAEFNATGSAIISANPTINSRCTNLQVGQILCIPDGSCAQEYTVLKNDTCESIGTEFNVTSSAIISANPTSSYGCNNLPLGLTLCIRNETCMQSYTVASGDICDGIGAKFSVSGSDIISANPSINSGCTNLQIGQILCIPDRSCMQKYTVTSGDTCDGIGGKFGVTGTDIISANPTVNSWCTNIQGGQILCIPDGSCTQKYAVVSGDTCNSIGSLLGVTGSAIMSANPTVNSNCTNLRVGQILCIPSSGGTIGNWQSCTASSTCADNWQCCVAPEDCATLKTTCRPNGNDGSGSAGSCAQEYTVVSGDNCNLIGEMYNLTGSDIMSANPTMNSRCINLQIGQILCIPSVGGDTIANWLTCTKGASTCANGWQCCVAPADCATGKTTCRPGGSECSSCSGGTVGNWQTCTEGASTCANGWQCCVAPADCATRKTTCRPGGSECSSCDGRTSKPTRSPSSSPPIAPPNSHLKVLLISIFTLLGGVIIAMIIVIFLFLSRNRGQDRVQKNHGEGSTNQDQQTTSNGDIPSSVHIQNSDDVSSIGPFFSRTANPENFSTINDGLEVEAQR
jgi:LysM repeat protein